MFVLLSSLRYLLTKQKARSPAVKRVPHAFVQKQNLFCSFYAFVSGIRTGSAAFALRTPLSLLRVWIVLIIAYCQNFASTFVGIRGIFSADCLILLSCFFVFSSRIPVFCFLFFRQIVFGLNNFKITVFSPRTTWVYAGLADGPVRQSLFHCFFPALRCHSLAYRRVSLPISYVIQNLALFLALSYHVLYRTFVLFYAGFFRHFPILYIL